MSPALTKRYETGGSEREGDADPEGVEVKSTERLIGDNEGGESG